MRTDRDSVTSQIVNSIIVPTMRPSSTEGLCSLIRVMHEEGFGALEILCRPADKALRIFAEIANRPERDLMLVGLGTVTTASDARAASALGADFLVAPGFSRRVLGVAAEAGTAYIPGVWTYQDIQNVTDGFDEHGLAVKVLKLLIFPWMDSDYLNGLWECYSHIRYCPSGGMTIENLAAWKSSRFIGACMGGQYVTEAMLQSGDLDAMRARLRKIREIAANVTITPAFTAAG